MAQHRDLGHILAGFNSIADAKVMLRTFWTRYRKICPGFQLWQQLDQGVKKMEECVPLYLHGDEGVTYKRGGVLILSFQSPLGFGTSKGDKDLSLNLQDLGEAGLPLNFNKSGMYTRMLMVVCPKDMYKEDPRVWNAIFERVVADFSHLEEHGLDLGTDGKIFPIIIGNKGDWSYLVTSGNLERSYRRSPKGAKEEGRDVEGAGICHLCLGGQSFDWENLQMAEKAMAESREHALPVPWFREAAMTRMLIHDSGCNGKSRFYKLDLWHGFHLGIGKSWAAGGLLMIQQFLEGGNMDDRFKQMSAMYVQFCKANKIDKIISKIDKYLCGGGGSAEPLGTWNKAAVTTNLCLFMEWFFTENPDVVTHDDGVYYMAHGTAKINSTFRRLYSGDLWLRRELGLEIAGELLQFIRSYCFEAWFHLQKGQSRFGMYPELHLLHEVHGQMIWEASKSEWIYNPIAETCSMDEDFVGRCAILTRSVSPRLNSLRSLQRYLAQIQMSWRH
ncbi:unnamed protein product [Cladocopium goreaui]|uniref:Uncharacterized protein n=1 Tax=Cladocopium goreaui TaxID=2562237 RepID=A0A9P1BJH0_9DINO|nr:unnamed protein product [Cladocopium goreaui]